MALFDRLAEMQVEAASFDDILKEQDVKISDFKKKKSDLKR